MNWDTILRLRTRRVAIPLALTRGSRTSVVPLGPGATDFERNALVDPGATDVMSYCTHVDYWISDYFFNKALRHRLAGANAEMTAVSRLTRTLLVWGGRGRSGRTISGSGVRG